MSVFRDGAIHFNCIVLRLCCTDNLQMSAPGLRGCEPEGCRGRAPAACERSGASWPRPPLGSKDTLTDSLSCVRAHSRTHARTLTHVHTHWDQQTHAHMSVHSFFFFAYLYMCTHACIKAQHTRASICASRHD